MVGWHHLVNGHELGQILGNSKGQGGLTCCSPWGCKESDVTQQLNDNKMVILRHRAGSDTGSFGPETISPAPTPVLRREQVRGCVAARRAAWQINFHFHF